MGTLLKEYQNSERLMEHKVMETQVQLHFSGPFSWTGSQGIPCIFTAEPARRPGVYLWTVNTGKGELVYYVGETGRSFATRMTEHFKEHMAGRYHLYKPEEFARGLKVLLWPGAYDPTTKTTVAEFLDNYDALKDALLRLAQMYRFYIAPIEGDKRLRERIEAALAYHLYSQEGRVGEFQDRGIRYRPRREHEAPCCIVLEADAQLCGIPTTLWV